MTQQTLEDFESMEVGQLKGILEGLDVAVPDLDFRKGENKAKLAQLAYDVSQPDTPQDELDLEQPTPDEPKPITTNEEIEAQKQEILDFFGATDLVESGVREDDDVVIFKVVDELTEEDKAEGTFLELLDQVRAPEASQEPPSLDEQTQDNEPEPPALEDVVTETPDIADDDNLAEIKNGIEPLRALGLKYTIDGSTIQFRVGSKRQTTTLNQPAHRVVNVAQLLCNYKK